MLGEFHNIVLKVFFASPKILVAPAIGLSLGDSMFATHSTNHEKISGLTAALLLSVTAHSLQTKTLKTMNTQSIEKFYIVGIATRTTNENGQSAQDIEALWGKFWGEGIQQQIPNQVNDDIYAVYTDYETDFTGPYTTVIGLAVHSLENIPAGFVGITIEPAVYQKFVSIGKMPEAVFNTWLEIWQNKTLTRAYNVDFTIHGKKYYDGDNASVETFISVKE